MRPIKRLALILSSLFLAVSFVLPSFSVSAASGPAITATLTDNAVQKGSKKTFDVWAKNSAGEKIKATVKLNGKIVSPTWDDIEKTSYTLVFTEEGENIVTVSASSDGGKRKELTYHITYVKAKAGEQIGTAIWSIELFTVGCGYLICPVSVPIYEGETSAEQLIRLLRNNGFVGYYGGTPKSAFYLGYIADGTVSAEKYNNYQKSGAPSEPRLLNISPKIPDILIPYLEETMTFFDPDDYLNNWKGYIGEFAFTNGSGWMYSVNNNFPNVGFSDTYLSDGDVVRVQYTLGYGADIGGLGSIGGNVPDLDVQPTSGYFAAANKDELCKAISRALTSGDMSKKRVKEAYSAAISVMETLNASQSAVDFAVNALNSALLDPGTETETALPETRPAVDLPETDPTAVPGDPDASDKPSDTEIPPEFVGPIKPPDSGNETGKPSGADTGIPSPGSVSDKPSVPPVTDSGIGFEPSNSGNGTNKPSGSGGFENSGTSSGSVSTVNKQSASGSAESPNKPSGSGNGSNKTSNSLLPSAPSSIIGVFRPSGLSGNGEGKLGISLPFAPEGSVFDPPDFAGVSNESFNHEVTSDRDSTVSGNEDDTQKKSDISGVSDGITDAASTESAAAGSGGIHNAGSSSETEKSESGNNGSVSENDTDEKNGVSPKPFIIAGVSAVTVAAAAAFYVLSVRRKNAKISADSESEGDGRNG